MLSQDIFFIFNWWVVFFTIGIIFLPLTFCLFNNFKDRGYIFSKIISLIFITYSVFIISSIKLLKYSPSEILLVTGIFVVINLYIAKKIDIKKLLRENFRLLIVEEIIFAITFVFWCFVRGNLPDIHGLEKYMDFGFVNSILRSSYFPPADMWYSGFSINYYYFGHLITATLIKLSGISSNIGYNLMLSSLFALTFSSVISIGLNLFDNEKFSLRSALTGLLSAALVALGGNLTTIYAFFTPYKNEHPVPLWNLVFSPKTFPNNFWYPNATRFIPYTIHEFPLYSFVVSDLHGHVLDIPIVLLTIAIIFSLYLRKTIKNIYLFFISFLLAIMYTTNAWDGIIYMLLAFMLIGFFYFHKENKKWEFSRNNFYKFIYGAFILIIGFVIFTIPFNIHFKPFVTGIGVVCAPQFLTNIGKIGPFLFEPNHCQRSPLWQLATLYGFFYFFVISFILFLKFKTKYIITKSDQVVSFLIILSTFLIIIPEFIYVKDIYPLHYRANTMFKLVYESFMMLSISCGYIIVKIISNLKNKVIIVGFFLSTLMLLYLVFIYPVFAINTFYNNLINYKTLDGTIYLKDLYPKDYQLINWVNKNIKGNPIILEANGDSYTDYARISANTGLPTMVGWPVHEWLWRGTYDIVAPRINDVQSLYTTSDINLAKNIIKKYNISYIVVSELEQQKYPKINENNFRKLGKLIYNANGARLYKIIF